MASPKLSIIMPFYNAAPYLDKALASIFNQTFKDFELILINDASTDDSEAVVKKYINDKRLVYLKNKNNLGIVSNLNQGLKIAKADIIARMDGDDVSDPTRLEKQFNFLLSHPAASLVGSFIEIIDETGRVIDRRSKPVDFEFIKKNLLIYSPLVHASIMARKDVIQKVGGYREKFLYCEDIDLFFRIIFSGYQVSNLGEYLYQYRYHPASVAHQSRLVACRLFKLRLETIRDFKLNVSLSKRLQILGQFLVGIIFSGRARQKLEGFYKTLFYHEK